MNPCGAVRSYTVHRPTTKRLDNGDFERSQITDAAEASDVVGEDIQSNGTGSGVAKERSATVRPLRAAGISALAPKAASLSVQ
jgi:hypothetical protein